MPVLWPDGGGGGITTAQQEVDPQLVYLNYLPISAFFGVKRYMHYITFLLILLGSLFTVLIFFINHQMNDN